MSSRRAVIHFFQDRFFIMHTSVTGSLSPVTCYLVLGPRRLVTVSSSLPRGAGLRCRAMIRAVDHINIVVADLQRSVRFYTEILGFTKTKEAYLEGEWIDRIVGLQGVKARAAFIVAPAGEPRIELLEYTAPRGLSPDGNSQAN